ncbi:hypothetical protein EJB05_39417, partial [Eragrostis curvula]
MNRERHRAPVKLILTLPCKRLPHPKSKRFPSTPHIRTAAEPPLLLCSRGLFSRHPSRARTMSNFFCRAWDRARGKSEVERICKKVFEDLADKNTSLLDVNSLHVATLMVYNSINKQLFGPHKDPPCLKVVNDQMEKYRAEAKKWITAEEFQDLILTWVEKDLRLVLANKAALAILGAPLLAVTAKNAGRQVPRMQDAVDKVPTPLLATVFSVGLLLLQDVRIGRQRPVRKILLFPFSFPEAPSISPPSAMGQAWASLQDKLQGRRWKEKQVRKITDRVFDRLTEDSKKRDKEALTFEEVYIAVLCVYNDINKYLPGPHHDPPSKERLQALMDEYDVNLDGLLDREEFAEFIRKLTKDSLCAISLKLVITLVAAPALAMATKRATEGVPGVGKVVRRVPNTLYASAITLGVLLVQKSSEGVE